MKPPTYWGKRAAWAMVLGAAIFLWVPESTWGQTLQITMDNQQLYSNADFSSTPIGPVPRGAQVKIIQQTGDWYRVDYQGKQGWLHRTAVRQVGPSQLSLPGILGSGGAVKETKSDEVALAGKGFTPEVEAGYRQKHPEMQFALVDQVEALQIDETGLSAFIQEGGLKP